MGKKDKKFKNTNDFTRNKTAFSNHFDDILRELEDELAQKNKGEERNTTEQPKTTEQLQITEENEIGNGSISSLPDFDMLDEFDFEKTESTTEEPQTNIENSNENSSRPSLFDLEILKELGYKEKEAATEKPQTNIKKQPTMGVENEGNTVVCGVTYVKKITEKKYEEIYEKKKRLPKGFFSKLQSVLKTRDQSNEKTNDEKEKE